MMSQSVSPTRQALLATIRALLGLWVAAVSTTGALASAQAAEPPELHAGRITADTPDAVRIRGTDAIAGLGDWYLTNGTLCAAVLGNQHSGILITAGGNLVDLGHCGRADDQFIGIEPMWNLNRDEMFRIEQIEAEVDSERAQIVTRASEPGLSLTTRYILDFAQPDRLTIHSRIERNEKGPRFFAMADMLLHAVSSLRNFIINDGGRFSGFRHVNREESRYLDIASSIRTADGVVLVGSEGQGPEIAYLYRPIKGVAIDRMGKTRPIDHYAVAFSSVTLNNWGTEPSWRSTRNPGLMQALRLVSMDLPVGESVEFEREVRVSKRTDVASLSDRVYLETAGALDPTSEQVSATVRVVGKLDDPAARIHVFRAGGDATSHITMARPDASGAFSFRVPRGRYRLEFVADAGRRVIRELDLLNTPKEFTLETIALGPVAYVTLPTGTPMHLVFRGMGETPDPVFGDDLSGLTLKGKLKPNSQRTRDVHLAGIDADPTQVRLAPGQYRVYATRGPEFSLSKTTLSVKPGEHATLEIDAPLRLFETPGWISADFHVHAAPSFDSTLPQIEQLRAFVSEGGEVLVSTEHDIIGEYASLIRELGLGDRVTTISGLEVTTVSPTPNNPHTTGHINLYPVPYRPELNRSGALQDEGLRLREIIALAHALPGERIVQLNHPREPRRKAEHGAFLDHLSVMGRPYDRERPLDAPANRTLIEADAETGLRDLDFDAMEIMNGERVDDYRLVLRDWFSFLSQGHRLAGMANSDTHMLGRIVSVPRNYVRIAKAEDLENFDSGAFIESARRGHLYGTTGPLLEVDLAGAGPGDRFSGNRATLRVSVRVAPWVPVDTLRIYLNGALHSEHTIDGSSLETLEFEFEFERDSYLVVEVEGPPTGDYAAVLASFTPLAFSNPIYIDADEDGQWSPPGLIGR